MEAYPLASASALASGAAGAPEPGFDRELDTLPGRTHRYIREPAFERAATRAKSVTWLVSADRRIDSETLPTRALGNREPKKSFPPRPRADACPGQPALLPHGRNWHSRPTGPRPRM